MFVMHPIMAARIEAETSPDVKILARFTTIHQAAAQGNVELLKYLVDTGADIDEPTPAAIQWAAYDPKESGRTLDAYHGVTHSILKGARHGLRLAHIAAKNGHVSVLKFLHSRGVSLETPGVDGRTPAHEGIAHFGVMQYLIRIGVQMVADVSGLTPIALAAQTYRGSNDRGVGVFQQLGYADSEGRTIVHWVAYIGGRGAEYALKQTSSSLFKLDNSGMSPAHYAAMPNDSVYGYGPEKKYSIFPKLKELGADFSLKDQYGCTPAHLIAFRGDQNLSADLSLVCVNPLVVDNEGQTLAHYAVQGPNFHKIIPSDPVPGAVTLDALKAIRARLDTPDKHGRLPVHILFKCATDACKYKQKFPELQLDARDGAGRTPAHNAAKYGRTGSITQLQKAGAPIEVFDDAGLTPLHDAILGGHVAIVEEFQMLLRGGLAAAKPTQDGRSLNDLAFAADDIDVLAVVFEHCRWANVSGGSTPAHWAAAAGRVDHLELAHTMGKPLDTPDGDGHTPLDCAAAAGKLPAILLLHSLTASSEESLMVWAVQQNRVDIIIAYIDGVDSLVGPELDYLDGSELDELGGSELGGLDLNNLVHIAAAGGHVRILELLHKKGVSLADMSAGRPSDGATPVHVAAAAGQAGALITLAEFGAPLEACTDAGWTPMHFAAQTDQPQALEALCRLDANPSQTNINAGDWFDWTPLHCAAAAGHLDTVLKLIGITGVFSLRVGGTPLHCAAAAGHLAVVQALVKAGAPTDVLNADGHTPEYLAASAGYGEVFSWLYASK